MHPAFIKAFIKAKSEANTPSKETILTEFATCLPIVPDPKESKTQWHSDRVWT